MPNSIVTIESMSKAFTMGNQVSQVLSDVDLKVADAEQIALMGASGSGKSTLLNIIAAYQTPDSGLARFQQRDIHLMSDNELAQWRRKELGVVFQNYNLLAPLTARQNIDFCLSLAGKRWDDWSDYLCQQLQVSELLDKYPHQLSGGQQQRIAIARAIAHKPLLLLADEPTGNLDQQASEQVMQLLVELSRVANSAIIMVTHSREAANYLQKTYTLIQGKLQLTRDKNSEQENKITPLISAGK
ncbi:ABC transporter ATP-binding protein [Paraferrimonas haliotis]|uniref:ABC transporter n=1 Tax=Paraferrimonas haliotis TaxID=2013866 RepID=A0AA37TX55_9GAMM|nr:ABC transporter ATP-binding protein [Paraferrimonas haliotis]GLS83051.1 ABC transporter [Paraferrimonas haliotis]